MSATEANGWTLFGPHIRGRKCGSCQCCTLVPVELPSGYKPANVRCPMLTSRGCGVYATRPRPCWAWSCRWLFDESTVVPGIRRPDIAGFAIDPMLDTILIAEHPVEVIQVWCDPKRRDAHRDPALRAWLAAMCTRYGFLAIVRWGSKDGLVLIAPDHNVTGEWLEHGGELKTQDAMRAKLAEVGAVGVLDQLTGRAP
jgi:hypothetical protein